MFDYKCVYCERKYKRKIYYDRHVLLCKVLSLTSSEREIENQENDDTPLMRDMYLMIQELSYKYEKVQKQLDEVTKWANIKKRNFNVIDWLNNNYSNPPLYDDFIDSIQLDETHLELVFKYDYINGIIFIFKDLFPLSDNNLPIKAFDQKDNTFFIFDKNNAWITMNGEIFDKFLKKLSKKIINLFTTWQDENINKMNNEKFTILYTQNVKKVMGGNASFVQQKNILHKKFYNYLKVNLKNIVQYDFST